MTRDEIAALFARREKAMLRRDAAALAVDHADDGVYESPWVGTVTGRKAIEQVYHAWFIAFPDCIARTEDLLVDDDGKRAVWVATLVGTDLGGFMGLPPTRKPFRMPLVALVTLNEQHLFSHHRNFYDFTGMLVQIGVLKAKPA